MIEKLKAFFDGLVTAALVSKTVDLCLSFAFVTILAPATLAVAYRGHLSDGEWIVCISAFVGGALLLLLRIPLLRYEEKKRRTEWYEQWFIVKSDEYIVHAMERNYVVTPRRLQILANRGATADVVEDLGKVAASFTPPIEGYTFIESVFVNLGWARFQDEIRDIIDVHDASKPLSELLPTAKSPAPSPPSPPA